MKRFIALTLAVLIALSLCAVASAEKYVVNTESTPLNIRLASDHSVILGGIAKGKTVNIDYFDKFWGYFTYDGQLAVVYKEYLVKADGSSKPSTTPSTSKPGPSSSSAPKKIISINEASMIYVVSDNVNDCIHVRTRKDTKASSLGELYPGDRVFVVSHGYKWSRVVFEGRYGYVLSKCLEFDGYNLPDEGELYQVKVANGTTLNVRVQSDKSSDVIRTLANGAFVKQLEEYPEWSLVYYDLENKGFVMNKFIIPVEEE